MMRRPFAFQGVFRGPGAVPEASVAARYPSPRSGAQRPERFSVTAAPKEKWLAERFASR
jgi:hypothetical protein